jgi:hypothetical protein
MLGTMETSFSKDLSLDGGWRIGEEAFAALVEELQKMKASRVVEFGSGVSSVRLALALPDIDLLSIESSTPHFEEVKALAARHGVSSDRVRFELRPLRWQWCGGALYQSYGRGDFPTTVDAAIVDGPPSRTRRGREACLHAVMANLRVGGKVFLDDFERPAEHVIVANWLNAYPGVFVVQTLRVGHSLAVLEKVRQVDSPRFSAAVTMDSLLENAKRAAKMIASAARSGR